MATWVILSRYMGRDEFVAIERTRRDALDYGRTECENLRSSGTQTVDAIVVGKWDYDAGEVLNERVFEV